MVRLPTFAQDFVETCDFTTCGHEDLHRDKAYIGLQLYELGLIWPEILAPLPIVVVSKMYFVIFRVEER